MTNQECYCNYDYMDELFKTRLAMYQLDEYAKPMPFIGMYMGAATLVCTIAIAADVVYAIRWKKFWFPCKYFTLNAASLTVLTVVTKLSVDLTTPMPKATDQFAKIGNTMLITTFMGNFITSLGAMDGKSMLANMIAVAILVITIIVNIGIQISTQVIKDEIFKEQIVVTILMLIVLLISTHSALSIPATKKILQVKYRQVYKRNINEELSREGNLTSVKLKSMLTKIWMMAETSSPQFVVGRSVASLSLSFLCFLNGVIYVEVGMRVPIYYGKQIVTYSQEYDAHCDYSISMIWILIMQSIALIIGSLQPFIRWFVFISFKSAGKQKSYKEEFKTETYWIETLVRWRKKPLPLPRDGHRWTKLQQMKKFSTNLLIWFQILMVIINKFSMAISCFPVKALFWFFHILKRCKKDTVTSHMDQRKQDSHHETELDLSPYVLYLEGEVQLPKKAIKMICYELNELIKIGNNVKPKKLITLLQRSENFSGVNHFDQVQERQQHEELPSSWTLPVMTLSTILIALFPHGEIDSINEFIGGATEGIKYADFVDKALELRFKMGNIRNAVQFVWSDVEIHHTWLEVRLKEISQGKSFKEILLILIDRAEMTLKNFKDTDEGSLMDPLDWPFEVIAANSMSRIGKTLILAYEEGGFNNDDRKFHGKLHTMIADILSACLTNLPHVMLQDCLNCNIEKREKRVRRAAQLFGETEEILELLEAREVPIMDPDKAICIGEWQVLLSQEIPPAFTVTSNDGISSPSIGDHVSIDVQA